MLFCSATTTSTAATAAAARIDRTMVSRRLRVGFMGMAVGRRQLGGGWCGRGRCGRGVAFLAYALADQAGPEFAEQPSAAQARRDRVGNQHEEEHRIGRPYIRRIATHLEEAGGFAAHGEK